MDSMSRGQAREPTPDHDHSTEFSGARSTLDQVPSLFQNEPNHGGCTCVSSLTACVGGPDHYLHDFDFLAPILPRETRT